MAVVVLVEVAYYWPLAKVLFSFTPPPFFEFFAVSVSNVCFSTVGIFWDGLDWFELLTSNEVLNFPLVSVLDAWNDLCLAYIVPSSGFLCSEAINMLVLFEVRRGSLVSSFRAAVCWPFELWFKADLVVGAAACWPEELSAPAARTDLLLFAGRDTGVVIEVDFWAESSYSSSEFSLDVSSIFSSSFFNMR